ncbi:MAG: GNAT family N-acetyltransferase [Candidatus Woesearchaeota archaeon]
MEIKQQEFSAVGIKFFVEEDGKEIGRGFLYVLKNDLHPESFWGFLEDVFVEEEYRKKGYGKALITVILDEAKKRGCYKLLATSRYGRDGLHKYYEEIGFKDHGKEFRMDL